MSTVIELHIIAYFTLLLFILLAVKSFLKTHANIWAICGASLMFAIIKFLLDFFAVAFVLQLLVILIYFIIAVLVVNKLNHITKLIISCFVAGAYYLCLAGINWCITVFLFNSNIYYISNFYLVFIIGLNFILFALFSVVTEYYKSQKPAYLTKNCVLIISNQKIAITGFVDTGNSLVEPKSGQSVVIISLNAVKKYLSDQMYADLMFATNSSNCFKDINKIKYSTISGTNFLTIFKPDKFLVNGKPVECFVGITLKTMHYDALLTTACL